METQPIIEAYGVTKVYRTRDVEVRALDGVDISVDKGEMVSVMGPSGSGKTTLLNCLSGLDTVESGDVKVAGNVIAEMSDNDLSEYRASTMGFIFQSYNLLPVLTAQENVELPLVLTGVKQSLATEKAMEKFGAGWSRRSGRPHAVGAFRRSATAGHDRARFGERSGIGLGGRAHRQLGLVERRRDHGVAQTP